MRKSSRQSISHVPWKGKKLKWQPMDTGTRGVSTYFCDGRRSGEGDARPGPASGFEAARGVAAVTGGPLRSHGPERITPAICSPRTGMGSRTSSGI